MKEKATPTQGIVNVERAGEIAILTIDHPPINALNLKVRTLLLRLIREVDENPDVRAIVIESKGRHFVAGADIREFDHEPQAPLLDDVLTTIENCSKPVIAAMQGSVLGGGLELALACHGRLAASNAVFGMPEIRLGLLPGSGGTQRLPRLIGLAKSLQIMGLPGILSGIRALALAHGDQCWRVSPLLIELAGRGTSLSDWKLE
jgi:3-hydroxyacyl-CoA dehydrogenase